MILVNDVKEHNIEMIMEDEMPTNLTKEKTRFLIESEASDNQGNNKNNDTENTIREIFEPKNSAQVKNDTKIHLNFSVERLLGAEEQCFKQARQAEQCCDNSQNYYSSPMSFAFYKSSTNTEDNTLPSTLNSALVKPTPIRAMGNTVDAAATISSPFGNPLSLMRFHGFQQTKQKSTQHLEQTLQSLMTMPMHHSPASDNSILTSAQIYAMSSYQLQNPANFHLRISNTSEKQNNSFFYNNNNNHNNNNNSNGGNNSNNNNKNYRNLISSLSTATSVAATPQNSFQPQQQQQQHNKQGMRNAASSRNNNDFSIAASNGGSANKRKRSWSRAVFSNLQRKGLEIQFQQQKYITKPDRRKLAARLNLTDAQVKVWFQNRRMKWRHTRENLKSGQEKLVGNSSAQTSSTSSVIFKNLKQRPVDEKLSDEKNQDYSSDGDSSIDASEHEDNDEGDIDVVE